MGGGAPAHVDERSLMQVAVAACPVVVTAQALTVPERPRPTTCTDGAVHCDALARQLVGSFVPREPSPRPPWRPDPTKRGNAFSDARR